MPFYLKSFASKCARPYPRIIHELQDVNGTTVINIRGDFIYEHDFPQAVVQALFVTLMSELGDKSFFMSAILAMHHSRTRTFIGSMLAQIPMTILAVAFGVAASFIPDTYTEWASFIIMTFFGIRMLAEGLLMESESTDDADNPSNNGSSQGNDVNHNSGKCESNGIINKEVKDPDQQQLENSGGLDHDCIIAQKSTYSEGVMFQAFTVNFFSEWGDRSQIAMILLATNENPYGVAIGGIIGHIICSGTAVFGGRLVAKKFPVKTMTTFGGIVFLLCAASSLVFSD